jgi:multiple sugar transport system ATP-binding protein
VREPGGELVLRGLSRFFGDLVAVRDFDLQVPAGLLVCLLGPSGCGKTTTLRMIAGLERPDAGQIWLDGEEITSREPRARHIGMMFQGYALYPHMTVRGNIAYPLRVRGVEKVERNRRVNNAAELVGVADLLDAPARQLSGGQQQRVALARAMVQQPKLYLLDEPVSALDAVLRSSVRAEIKRLQRELGTTMLIVTHDQLDALSMADLIVVMCDGQIQQVGTPREVYHCPNSVFVARFLGEPQINLLRGTALRRDGRLGVGVLGTWVPLGPETARALESDGEHDVTIGVRPAAFKIVDPATPQCISGEVQLVEPLGDRCVVRLQTDGSVLTLEAPSDNNIYIGETMHIEILPEQMHIFSNVPPYRRIAGGRVTVQKEQQPA